MLIPHKVDWFLQTKKSWLNRPIVLSGSGLETGHPDQGPALFHTLCCAENSEARSSFVTLSSSGVPARIFFLLTVLGFFD